MITTGESYPLVYEMRITASELDMIIKGLNTIKDPSEAERKLLKEYETISEIRTVRALRRYGSMDSSRLNWK